MPIRPENKHRYPRNWREIRAAILERAKHKCERCGLPNHTFAISGQRNWTKNPLQAEAWKIDGHRVIRIVLTIAHLDHQPENCAEDNLQSLCQRCHLAHDAAHHQQTAYQTRRNGKAAGDLFDAHP